MSEKYNNMKKEIETIKKNQEEIKNTISKIKYTLEGITCRLGEAEDQISELEDKVEWNTQVEQLHKKRLQIYEDSLRELQDNMKHNNIQIIGIPEGEEKEQGTETLFEKMTENFPNLERGKTMQVQEAHKVPIKMNPKRTIPRHIIIKMPSFKDKENFKGSKGQVRSNKQRSSNKAISWFLNRNTTSQKGFPRPNPSHEKQAPTTKTTPSGMDII